MQCFSKWSVLCIQIHMQMFNSSFNVLEKFIVDIFSFDLVYFVVIKKTDLDKSSFCSAICLFQCNIFK